MDINLLYATDNLIVLRRTLVLIASFFAFFAILDISRRLGSLLRRKGGNGQGKRRILLEKQLEQSRGGIVTIEPSTLQRLYKRYVYNGDHTLDYRYDPEEEGWTVISNDEPGLLQHVFRKHVYNQAFANVKMLEVMNKGSAEGRTLPGMPSPAALANGVLKMSYHPPRRGSWGSFQIPTRVWMEQENALEDPILCISSERSTVCKNIQEEVDSILGVFTGQKAFPDF